MNTNAKLQWPVRLGLSLIVCTLFIFPAGAADYGGVPFYPYRKVGDRYYDLTPIYNWLALQTQPQSKLTQEQRTAPQPMPQWFASAGAYDPDRYKSYNVLTVFPGKGILVQETWGFTRRGEGGGSGNEFFLVNHPAQATLTDQTQVVFLALQVGTFQYRDVRGGLRTVPKYDYGIPYDPRKLAAERTRTNSAANH